MHKISSALTIPFLTTFSWINLLFCKTLRNIWQKYVSAIGVAQGQRCRKQFFLNGPTPASFSFTFGLCKQTLQIFTTNICEKCPSRIRYRDLNPQPSECESPPITTRPGLPPVPLTPLFHHCRAPFDELNEHMNASYLPTYLPTQIVEKSKV